MSLMYRTAGAFCVTLALGTLAPSSMAQVLDFDYKINQGPVGTDFASLTLTPTAGGGTSFSLTTSIGGGNGDPGIVELLFGCNNCTGNFSDLPSGSSIQQNVTQASYAWDYSLSFDPSVYQGNVPVTWTSDSAPSTYLEFTSGAGPDALAMIQLTGGSEVVNGVDISSGFYVATSAAPIPEPSTYALLLSGLGLVATLARRRRK